MPIKDVTVKYRCEICKHPYQGRNSLTNAIICEQTEAPVFKWKVGDVLRDGDSTWEITGLHVYRKTHKAGYKVVTRSRDGNSEIKQTVMEKVLVRNGYDV